MYSVFQLPELKKIIKTLACLHISTSNFSGRVLAFGLALAELRKGVEYVIIIICLNLGA